MKLIAFNRGKAISADPIWMGTNRFVKPPKSAGIIRKKIIKKAWAVMTQRTEACLDRTSKASEHGDLEKDDLHRVNRTEPTNLHDAPKELGVVGHAGMRCHHKADLDAE